MSILQPNQKNIGGMPSVLLIREVVSKKLGSYLKKRMDECLSMGSCGA